MVFAILLLLGLQRGRSWPRSELAEILWPDASYPTRASRLRWLLAKLRALGLEIENKSTDVSLRETDVRLDVDEAASAVPAALSEVLAGYAPRFSVRFAKWLDTQRDELNAAVLRAIVPRLRELRQLKDWPNILPTATAVLRFDPLNEEGITALAECQYRLGLATQAQSRLEHYLAALGDTNLDAQLRVKLLLRRIRSAGEIRASATEPRFVGRTEQLTRIEGMLNAAGQGRGCALMLVGPPGIGKTKLLDEATIRARIAGMQVVRIRCQRGDASRPLSGIVDLVSHLLGVRGAAGCSPENLMHLRRLTNATQNLPGLESDRASASPKLLRAQIVSALVDLLDAVSSESPLVVQIDDAQWIDRSLKTLWNRLFSLSSTRPIAWLFACRPARNDTPAFELPVVRVGTMHTEAASELVDELLKASANDIPLTTRATLLSRGGGNPLILCELVRQWRATGHADTLPTSVLALFESGLAGLNRYALRVLQVAAILGTHATPKRIESVVQLTRARFIDALTELENAGILSTDTAGATYGHILWAEAAVAALPSGIARVLHRHAAEMFEEELTHTPSATLLWESARHWELAGYSERARHAILQGAEHLAQNGFPGDAADALLRVIRRLEDPSERLPLLRRRLTLLRAAGRWKDVVVDAEMHEKLSGDLDPQHDPHSDVELMKLEAMYWHSREPSALERSLACGRDPAATDSHRLRALKEFARATAAISGKSLAEACELARSIPVRTFEDSWNRSRVELEFEIRFGSIDAAIAITDCQLRSTLGETMAAYHAHALQQASDTYIAAGYVAEGTRFRRMAIELYTKLGMSGPLLNTYESALGWALHLDSLRTMQNALAAAKKASLLHDPLHEQDSSDLILLAHEIHFALLSDRPEFARLHLASLEQLPMADVPRVRAMLLAMRLEMQFQLSETAGSDETATALRGCFGDPERWLDWPASVYARHLERAGRFHEAGEFSRWFIFEVRRERYAVPESCSALTRLANMRSTESVATRSHSELAGGSTVDDVHRSTVRDRVRRA